ncbi:MAG: Lacal_2735 family protein [Planctomycetota bacterium]
MFGSGNSKEKLEKKYATLLEQSHKLSHTNRKQSDLKMAEAEKVLARLKALDEPATK